MRLPALILASVFAAVPAFAQSEAPSDAPAEAAVADTSPGVAAVAVRDADPALFRLGDKDTTVYLFGTFHLLDGKTSWFDEAVRDAFETADELVIETVTPDPAIVAEIITARAIDPTGTPLSATMTPGKFERLVAETAKLGLPAAALEPMDPWFAAITLVGLQYAKLGLTPENGADQILRNAAEADGKPVSGLEEFAWQIDLFDTLSEPQQVAFLEAGLDDLVDLDMMVGALVEGWNEGDIDTVAALVNDGFAADAALRDRLLTDRNGNWADWIEQRLETPGTVFMAVGVGHLAGTGSVQDQLADRGIETERVAY
ncbi:MAG: TraB/GumN family protein [Pseudomonadota bacterium]